MQQPLSFPGALKFVAISFFTCQINSKLMEDYLKHVSPKLVDGVKSVVDRAATLRGQTKVIAW